MDLKTTHLEIMQHTDLNKMYCGEEPELIELAEAGLMKCLGRKPFVPEPYWVLTTEGRETLRKTQQLQKVNKCTQ